MVGEMGPIVLFDYVEGHWKIQGQGSPTRHPLQRRQSPHDLEWRDDGSQDLPKGLKVVTP